MPRGTPGPGPAAARDADARTRRVDLRTRPRKCRGGQIEVHWAASQALAGVSIVYETVNGAARGQDIHRQIFEKNLAVQLLIDPDTGRIVEANPAACAFYGYAREELIQRKITDINSLPVSEVHAAMGQANGERRNTFRFRHRLATGEIRDVEVHSGPIEVDGRRLLYSIVHDVTDSERAQAELHRTISLLQSTLDSTTDGLLAIDRQGRIVSYNQRFAQMWRIPREVLETGDDEKVFAFSVGELRDPDQFRRKVQQVYAQPDLESFDVLEFNDGRVIQYTGVSPEVHRRLINAPSIVSYFRDNVEESFPAKRVKG